MDEQYIETPLFPNEAVDETRARVRTSDPATSLAGAHDVAYRAGSQKARLLAAYVDAYPAGLTDEEAAKIAGLYELRTASWWKRCSELRDTGEIVPTSETRRGESGSERMVCRASAPY
jgi:hypothetical protein